jgi:hypothetical protein
LLQAAYGRAHAPWFRSTLLAAIALTRRQEATSWLLERVENDDDEAAAAQEALCRSAPSEATRERLQQLGRPCAESLAQPDRA